MTRLEYIGKGSRVVIDFNDSEALARVSWRGRCCGGYYPAEPVSSTADAIERVSKDMARHPEMAEVVKKMDEALEGMKQGELFA